MYNLQAKVTVNGSVELPADEVALAKWLTANGPISIGINANALQVRLSFQLLPSYFILITQSYLF